MIMDYAFPVSNCGILFQAECWNCKVVGTFNDGFEHNMICKHCGKNQKPYLESK